MGLALRTLPCEAASANACCETPNATVGCTPTIVGAPGDPVGTGTFCALTASGLYCSSPFLIVTFKNLPCLVSKPFMPLIAMVAACGEAYDTKPKPFEALVTGSTWILA